MASDHQEPEKYEPLALIGVTIIALLGFAVFFLSFLVAPLAILLIFYVGFAASDRSRRQGNGNGGEQEPSRMDREAAARQAVIERSDADNPPQLRPLPRS